MMTAIATVLVGSLGASDNTIPSGPSVRHVTVEGDVTLEILDWGGNGSAVVFLAALGADAHEFDEFAPKFTSNHHVYGITRRGFGDSSKPDTGYTNERLGHDVIEVLDALRIDRAVLVGHSMAGMELSWVGTHKPERVAGLVYLEAAYGYAYYNEASNDPQNVLIDAVELKHKLSEFLPGGGRPDRRRVTAELLKDVTRIERELRDYAETFKDQLDPPMDPANPPHPPAWLTGIYQGLEKYTKIDVPVLAIYCVPHALSELGDPTVLSKDPIAAAKTEDADRRWVGSQVRAFRQGVPTARVVEIPHGSHFIFRSNEPEVFREIDAFLKSLATPFSKELDEKSNPKSSADNSGASPLRG